MVLRCKRVIYAKPNIPMNKREYNLPGISTAVGCINEVIEHIAKPHGYTHLYLEDIDGNYTVDVENSKIIKS